MINAEFYKKDGNFSGFTVSGHAGYADAGQDIVCASVSSAVQLIVNLLSEFGCSPAASAEGDTVECKATSSYGTASAMLGQLVLHFEAISEEFPETIKITISEV